MNGVKVTVEDMGKILFTKAGGIRTQDGRILRGLLKKIDQLKHENEILRKENNDLKYVSENKR